MNKKNKIGKLSFVLISLICFIFLVAYDKCPTAKTLCQQRCEERYVEYKKPSYEIIGVDKGSDNTHLRCDCYLKKEGKR